MASMRSSTGCSPAAQEAEERYANRRIEVRAEASSDQAPDVPGRVETWARLRQLTTDLRLPQALLRLKDGDDKPRGRPAALGAARNLAGPGRLDETATLSYYGMIRFTAVLLAQKIRSGERYNGFGLVVDDEEEATAYPSDDMKRLEDMSEDERLWYLAENVENEQLIMAMGASIAENRFSEANFERCQRLFRLEGKQGQNVDDRIRHQNYDSERVHTAHGGRGSAIAGLEKPDFISG
ncbi:uncharacterized protein BO97DRAFT_419549 [Aspergillus homomorphus CBS 101889]|uniref:Uncharacterized protein n=1 Tax=Aspergillus homomorphus (strain CBS 101889) TaxID=1450537 RepID=A0A395IBG3_ASPHC|nr:hypothetical protein BO97DRAFT_419549 [Aspergillus homomorphus CBS 101889]RAL17305.1 hypothetical protein BO97DRAFT_419549 [Aspergillus homomorphus CBS 101889]